MEKAVLFGASKLGEIAYSNLKDKFDIVAFIDNDKKKQDTKFCGLDVFNPQILKDNNYMVIISSMFFLEIMEQLINYGIRKFAVFNMDNDSEVRFFDYSHIDNFSTRPNKIALIMENNSGSNTRALLKKASNEIISKYELVALEQNNKNEDYFFHLLTSEMLIYTHDALYKENKIKVQLWHGFPLKGLSYMSNYFTKEEKNKNHREWEKLDVIASYSQTYSTLMNASYGLDGNKYCITGMPRNDFLFDADGREALSEVLNIDLNNKKVILYMPTFRKTVSGQENGQDDMFNILDIHGFDEELFNMYLEENNIVFLIKYHPVHVYKDKKGKNMHILKDESFRDKNLDLYEIINAADLLITDYSSIYFDYLLLDRPIVFTPLDLEAYTENRGFLLEPYDFWAPGPKCYNFEQLAAEIIICLNDNSYYQKERETICNIVHHYKDANSSERVWKVIDQLMSKS